MDLLKMFLKEEFGDKVATHQASEYHQTCLISIVTRQSVPNEGGTLYNHHIIGGMDEHEATINVQAPYALQYFTWEDKVHNETKNIADPDFFKWLKESIQAKIMNIHDDE